MEKTWRCHISVDTFYDSLIHAILSQTFLSILYASYFFYNYDTMFSISDHAKIKVVKEKSFLGSFLRRLANSLQVKKLI